MLSFLRASGPKRTKISDVSTLMLDNGRSSVSFQKGSDDSSQKFAHVFMLPPSEPGENPKDNSIVIPPFHIHPNQEEIFHVISGTALFHLNFDRVPISEGNEITIPRGDYHKFTNASTTGSVTLEAWYNPAEPEREERFFRNLYGYLGDVSGDGGGMLENASVAQLSLFAWEADMAICEPMVALRIPKVIGIPLSKGLTWFLGVVIGKWMLGYEASYEEYYHKSSS